MVILTQMVNSWSILNESGKQASNKCTDRLLDLSYDK